MLRTIMAASLAAGALAFHAPVAHADEPAAECRLAAAQDRDTMSQGFQGIAFGYATHGEGGTVAIRCVIRVNGNDADATDWGTYGAGHAVTYGPVGFQAMATDVVEVCTEVKTAHGTRFRCEGTMSAQLPPQEFVDLLEATLRLPCIGLATLGQAGFDVLGIIRITPEGDVLVGGQMVFDC